MDLSVVPFEPITVGSGQGTAEKQGRLSKAIQERISTNELERLRKGREGRLVTVTVIFYLWKGAPSITNTRPVKDIDNLLKVLFDVLKLGPNGLGLVAEDSYICEVYATKQLVAEEEEEGYRIIIEEYADKPMLHTLEQFYSAQKK